MVKQYVLSEAELDEIRAILNNIQFPVDKLDQGYFQYVIQNYIDRLKHIFKEDANDTE